MELEIARNILARQASKEAQLKEATKVVAEADGSSDDSKEPVKDSDDQDDEDSVVE